MPTLDLPANWLHRPRLVAAGRDAAWLHLAALLYCVEHLTDGRLPAGIVPRLTCLTEAAAAAAVSALMATQPDPLWRKEGRGYVLDDEGALPRREAVEYDRETAKGRMRRLREARRAVVMPEGVDLDQLRDLTARDWHDDERYRHHDLIAAAAALGASDQTRRCASLVIDLLVLGAEPPVAEAVVLKDPERAADWLDHPERWQNARNPAGLIISRLRSA